MLADEGSLSNIEWVQGVVGVKQRSTRRSGVMYTVGPFKNFDHRRPMGWKLSHADSLRDVHLKIELTPGTDLHET